MDDESYAAVITESGWVFPIDVLTSDNYYIVNPHTVIGSVAVSKEDCERLLDKFGTKGASDENLCN
jgi:hypothetical protein